MLYFLVSSILHNGIKKIDEAFNSEPKVVKLLL